MWKKLGEKGLQSLFHKNVNFQETVYKLYALAYVPPQHVVRFYVEFVLNYIECQIDEDDDWKEMSDELDEFGKYYTNTWIGKVAETRAGSGNGIRRKPLYSIDSWNQYDSVLSGVASTTNNVESFNRTWNMLAGNNPNIWSCFRSKMLSLAEFFCPMLWVKT